MNDSRTTAELWSRDADLVLRDLVLRSSEEINWNHIATAIEWDSGAVTPSECRERWDYVKETPVKGPWSSEEDDHLKRLVDEFGSKKWNLLARAFPGRSGKQCRERWHNHVDGRVKKGEWSAEEDQILCEAQRQLGNKWSEMSKILVGRSENAIKNRFNSLNAKGLAETRANELMSKLAPEEKAALLNIDSDPPAPPRLSSSSSSSSTANKKKAGANSTHVGKEKVSSSSSSSSGGGGGGGSGSKNSGSKVKGGDVDGAGGRSKAGSGRKGANKKSSSSSSSNNNNSSSSSDSNGSDGRKSNGSSSSSSSNVDERGDGTREGSNASSALGFGTAAGGSKSDDDAAAAASGGDAGVGRSAAMEALMVAARGERTACGGTGDEGNDGGSSWSNSNNRGGAEAGARWKRGWAPAAGAGAERRGRQETAGGGGGATAAVAEPGRKAAKRPKGGQARRKTDMARAEAGMSVLAQAAGLLDIEDSVEAADGNSNSNGGGGGGGDAGRNGPDAHGMLATGMVDCRSNFGGGGSYASQYYGRLQTNGHNGSSAFIDHGSTPPGSASPPPSGPASGGGGSAAGGASPFGGAGGGCGGRTAGTADAFPVGARGVSSVGGARIIGRNSEYYHVGGESSYGGESGGGERASWGGLPSSSSSQRWSLHSVPGPWRPYWTGQDGGNGGGGGGGGGGAAAARWPRQDEGPDNGFRS